MEITEIDKERKDPKAESEDQLDEFVVGNGTKHTLDFGDENSQVEDDHLEIEEMFEREALSAESCVGVFEENRDQKVEAEGLEDLEHPVT